MGLKVAELETLFTADDTQFVKVATTVESRQKSLDGKSAELVVTADATSATRSMDAVEAQAKALPDGNVMVDADTAVATRKLGQVGADAKSIPNATVQVDADTSGADSKINNIGDKIGEQGKSGGDGLATGIIAAIATIPVAGAVVGIGASIGKALLDGLQVEVRGDRLQAMTGLEPETVARLGRAAGEAYANNFGSSIDENFTTARQAVQSGLLDPKQTQAQAQQVIQSLEGVASVMEEDVSAVARSTTQLLRTGLASSAQDAFDVIVKGQQAGLNVSEDWLDTINEYSTQWRKLGLTAPQVMGLLSQAVKNGARDTDIAADSLKEFSIRAVDGSATTADGFKRIGLSAHDMAEKIAAGGPAARDALQLTLDKLRDIEDPVKRDAAAVELFGTQAEDMGQALYSMDLGNAVAQLGNVEDAAKRAIGTLGDNAASDIESAKRNIEVAADGIKGALAAAFNPQIEGFAEYVSENRETVMRFLLDLANGGIDAGRALVNAAAAGTEGFGHFVNTVGPAVLGFIGDVLDGYAAVAGAIDPTGILGIRDAARNARDDFKSFKEDAVDSLQTFSDNTEQAADWMRTNLIEGALDPAQKKLNEFGLPLVQQAALHDALTATANDVANVGVQADGTQVSLTGFTGALDTSTEQGKLLNEQITNVVNSMRDQATASQAAGESSDDLATSLQGTRDELVNTLEQLGLNEEQANQLADAYGAVPKDIVTSATLTGIEAAQAGIDHFITSNTGRKINVTVGASGQLQYQVAGTTVRFFKDGGVAVPMADGGVLDSSIATMVPPGTPRIVGDRLDVPEAFIPMDGSARSRSILGYVNANMPGAAPMAQGGVTASGAGGDIIINGGLTLNVDPSKLQSVTQLETFIKTLPQLVRQKAGVHR